jgi:hypothetical protein
MAWCLVKAHGQLYLYLLHLLYINKVILCEISNDADHISEEIRNSPDTDIEAYEITDFTEPRTWRKKTNFPDGNLVTVHGT